jgi:arsenate reductase (glutaredoxin)
MITIYHNPRCSKSRGACELIDTSFNTANEPVKIIEYLREPLTVAQLKELSRMLGCPVRDMIRNTEPEYKDLNLGADDIDDNRLFEAIVKHPILLQRPIIVRNGKAVIGRPPENVKALFDE